MVWCDFIHSPFGWISWKTSIKDKNSNKGKRQGLHVWLNFYSESLLKITIFHQVLFKQSAIIRVVSNDIASLPIADRFQK